jgi:hypothetical protein
MGLYGLDRSGSGWGLVEGSYEHGNEPLGSMKCVLQQQQKKNVFYILQFFAATQNISL